MKSATEKGADVGGHLLLFINSRRGEIRPLCAVRLLVSPTHKFLRYVFLSLSLSLCPSLSLSHEQ